MKRPGNVIKSIAPFAIRSADEAGAIDRRKLDAIMGSRNLLRAQLRTGQYFPESRAEWLARHGGDV